MSDHQVELNGVEEVAYKLYKDLTNYAIFKPKTKEEQQYHLDLFMTCLCSIRLGISQQVPDILPSLKANSST